MSPAIPAGGPQRLLDHSFFTMSQSEEKVAFALEEAKLRCRC